MSSKDNIDVNTNNESSNSLNDHHDDNTTKQQNNSQDNDANSNSNTTNSDNLNISSDVEDNKDKHLEKASGSNSTTNSPNKSVKISSNNPNIISAANSSDIKAFGDKPSRDSQNTTDDLRMSLPRNINSMTISYYYISDPKINEFKKLFKSDEFNIFLISLNNYIKGDKENGFQIFKRGNKVSYAKIPPISKSQISRTSSQPYKPGKSIVYTSNIERTSSTPSRKPKLNEMKQNFLSHSYQKSFLDNYDKFNHQLFYSQVTCYMKNQNGSLATFQGFSLTDLNGLFLPIALTKRPVNGPLTSLFQTVNSNREEKVTDDSDDSIACSRSLSFNIDELETVTAEQKFSIIIGVIHGIAFIHDNGFIHSNLNPTTVYLNENLQSVICDYIFVPPFKVETLPEKDEYDQYQFKYSIKKEDAEELFKSDPFVAPEILNGGEFGQKSDIYSVGQIIRYILNDGELQDNFPENWGKIVQQCINEDPMKRPTAVDLLNELLKDENNAKLYVSSLSSAPAKISESTNLTLTIFKKNVDSHFQNTDPDLRIFHKMIPNVKDIDDSTRLLINAAEKGDIKSIEKVGDFFYKGGNKCILKDEEWAYSCYKSAADRGSLYSMLQVAKFNEEGIGTDLNLNIAYNYYCKAKNCEEDVKKKEEIEQKMKSLNDKRNALILSNVPIRTKPASINRYFTSLKITIINRVDEGNSSKFTIKLDDTGNNNMTKAQKIAKDLKKRYKYEIEFLGFKPRNKTHRLDSLDGNFLDKINLNRFYKGKNNDSFIVLGSGTYANTYLVYEVGTEKEIAAKVFKEKLNDSMINSFKREIIMAAQFKNHPAIVQYIGFNEHSLTDFYKNRQLDEMKPTLFMRYISGGNLEEAIIKARSLIEKENELIETKNELIEKLNKGEDKGLIQKEIDDIELKIKEIRNDKDYFNNTKKLKIIIGIASGLSEMFKHQIIHRDLKPENILLTENFEPVICDLGSSRQYSDEREQMSGLVGTPIYMAPELYNDEFAPAYRFEVDSYSYAIILYQLLELKLDNEIYPKDSSNSTKLMKYKFDNYLPDLNDDLNEVFRDIILLCWNISLDQRLDPTAIYNYLVQGFNQPDHLLPDVDVDDVSDYIKRLKNH